MIYTDNKITDKVIKVRAYYYSDPYKGWGDAGTKGYFEIPLKYFKETENQRQHPVGSSYFTYNIEEKKGIEIFGDYFWCEVGYELDEGKREKELGNIKKQLEIASKVNIIK